MMNYKIGLISRSHTFSNYLMKTVYQNKTNPQVSKLVHTYGTLENVLSKLPD